jgi:hypothetical protein
LSHYNLYQSIVQITGKPIDIIWPVIAGVNFFPGPVIIFFEDVDLIIHDLSYHTVSISKVYLKLLKKTTIFSSIPETF